MKAALTDEIIESLIAEPKPLLGNFGEKIRHNRKAGA